MSDIFSRILLIIIPIICFVISHKLEVCTAQHSIPTQPIIPTKPGSFMGANVDCRRRCHYRCSVASRYRTCLRDCSTCCQRCNCVPPGTSGNANTCPCWADMTTKNGRKKCP
ncbi:unnamed protein product [Amaranthus hypochondriacus]